MPYVRRSVPATISEIYNDEKPSLTITTGALTLYALPTLSVPAYARQPAHAYMDIMIQTREDTSAAPNYLKAGIVYVRIGDDYTTATLINSGMCPTPANTIIYSNYWFKGFMDFATVLTPNSTFTPYLYAESQGNNLILKEINAVLRLYWLN